MCSETLQELHQENLLTQAQLERLDPYISGRRISVYQLAAAMTAFTFNFYFGFEQLEIASTLAGIVSLGVAVLLIRFLEKEKAGFTSDSAYAKAWLDENAEAFVMSQTLGGNQQPANPSGGGTFGGGGASGDF